MAKMTRAMSFVLSVICMLLLSGCVFAVPVIQSFHDAGFTPADRRTLLEKTVEEFNTALYWGESQQVLSMSSEQGRSYVINYFRTRKGKEKIVEHKVNLTEFSDSAFDATVDVTVKYYAIPYFVVNERHESQKWEFSLDSGWKFAGLNAES